jgi:redox-sensitive bicupin YhaK (pirin superfamily)
MNRKDFLKKGLLGTGMFALSNLSASVMKNEIEELETLEVLGFNHIPNTKSELMENTVLHKAQSRGFANHGWLQSFHTFSFANYYNPERMHFGVLRVLNDDTVAEGRGFGTHPHDNMEIISIPLSGDLEHKDSMGNIAVIRNGDVQVMSAGTGIKHSEFNKNKDQLVKFLQIWVFPNKRNVTPRYDQMTLDPQKRKNKFQLIVSPTASSGSVWIHQDAYFSLADFDKGIKSAYSLNKKGNGVYAFVLSGSFQINGITVEQRDGLGLWNTEQLSVNALEKGEILLMEVPMQLS